MQEGSGTFLAFSIIYKGARGQRLFRCVGVEPGATRSVHKAEPYAKPMTLLTLEKLTISFGGIQALSDIHLQIEKEEILAIIAYLKALAE